MNKKVKRIHFYTKKIAKLGAVHPTKRDDKWRRRAVRLMSYKRKMHSTF